MGSDWTDARVQAVRMLTEAQAHVAAARALVDGDGARPPSRANRDQAFRLLAGVQSTCEVVKLIIR